MEFLSHLNALRLTNRRLRHSSQALITVERGLDIISNNSNSKQGALVADMIKSDIG